MDHKTVRQLTDEQIAERIRQLQQEQDKTSGMSKSGPKKNHIPHRAGKSNLCHLLCIHKAMILDSLTLNTGSAVTSTGTGEINSFVHKLRRIAQQ